MMRVRYGVLALALVMPAFASSLKDRLNENYLRALHRAAEATRAAAHPTATSGDYQDIRCAFHAHSGLSHDSRVTPEQVTEAAKTAGIRAMFMTEHPQPDRRWWTEGLRGVKDGVLFVPGAELSDGLLIWRSPGTDWTPGMKAGEVLERLKGTPGIAFIAHPEQRKKDADWQLPPFAGMEIYNTHADAVDSDMEGTLASFKSQNPLQLFATLNMLKKYPREAFAAIFDEQTAILNRWDTLNEQFLATGRRVVGIAGNDSHQNVGVTFEATEAGVVVKDGLGKVVSEIPKSKVPLLLAGSLKPGTVIASHQFDPYWVSLGYVSTHVLAKEVSEDALFDALLKGRAYVAFDWMGDPSGFSFSGHTMGRTIEMGESVPAGHHPTLTVHPNTAGRIRLLRNGVEVQKTEGAELTYEVKDAGVYRAEVWLKLGEEDRPWVYSNPIYVTHQ